MLRETQPWGRFLWSCTASDAVPPWRGSSVVLPDIVHVAALPAVPGSPAQGCCGHGPWRKQPHLIHPCLFTPPFHCSCACTDVRAAVRWSGSGVNRSRSKSFLGQPSSNLDSQFTVSCMKSSADEGKGMCRSRKTSCWRPEGFGEAALLVVMPYCSWMQGRCYLRY